MELIEYTGQELALIAKDEDAQERVFMEARLRDPKVSVSKRIDFTLQDLAEHFIIPEVQDVASVNPDAFQRNLKKLEELEQILAA